MKLSTTFFQRTFVSCIFIRNTFISSLILSSLLMITSLAHAAKDQLTLQLNYLKNFQINTATMLSSGLPNQQHFEILKNNGVTKVIDLIPGDRTKEAQLMKAMKLTYHNIAVEWNNPTVENFDDYISYMKQLPNDNSKVLTHCKLNWRGAVFTYLYRVTQLNEDENIARQDMEKIWQPNEIWQAFITKVKAAHTN